MTMQQTECIKDGCKEIQSTGLVWGIPQLHRRYKFLQKLKEEVSLRLLYYPYWLVCCSERIQWKFFGAKYTKHFRIMDARSARSQTLLSYPETGMEHIVFENNTYQQYNFADVLCTSKEHIKAEVHIAKALIKEEEAIQKGEKDTHQEMTKFYNRPLGFMAQISTMETDVRLLYKPFWIMQATQQTERMFIFDATTGIGGTSEYWNIVEYAYSLQEES